MQRFHHLRGRFAEKRVNDLLTENPALSGLREGGEKRRRRAAARWIAAMHLLALALVACVGIAVGAAILSRPVRAASIRSALLIFMLIAYGALGALIGATPAQAALVITCADVTPVAEYPAVSYRSLDGDAHTCSDPGAETPPTNGWLFYSYHYVYGTTDVVESRGYFVLNGSTEANSGFKLSCDSVAAICAQSKTFTDSSNNTQTLNFTQNYASLSVTSISSNIAVSGSAQPLSTTQAVASTTLTVGVAATAFTPVTASGGYGTLSYALDTSLPAGLSFNTSTGEITGTPTAASAGTTYAVTVTDSTPGTPITSSKTFDLTVNKGTQTITFPVIANTNYGYLPSGNFTRTIEMQATSSSGLAVTEYTTNDDAICMYKPYFTGTGTRQNILITGVGACTVTAAQSGDSNYEAATPVQRTFTIDKGSQSIVTNDPTFAAQSYAANKTFTVSSVAVTGGGTDYHVAGSSSELAVSYSSDTPSVCSVSATTLNPYFANPATIYFSNATVTLLAPGTCTLTMTQAGDEHYYAASSVQKSITINAPSLTTSVAVASSAFSAGTAITPFTPVTASGGYGTLTFAVSPTLPTGLSFNTATGEISGTPGATTSQASYTATATDSTPGTAQTSSKQFSLEITPDKTAPVISNLPADISVGNDPGLNTAVVTWTAPNANDNIGVTSFTSDHQSGDAFPIGKTKVTYTAKDAEGNTTTASFSVTVTDVDNPTVTSLTRQSPTSETTDADSLTWRVTFSENVQNVDASDFSVSGTTATVTGVNQQSASIYEVTVSGGDLANLNAKVTLGFGTQNIQDLAGNALTDTTPTGTDDNYFLVINDTTPPTVQIQNAPSSFSNLTSFNVTFEWSEDVTGFTAGDITLANATASNFQIVDASTYTADITPTGAGDITIDVNAGVAQDGANNDNEAAKQVTVSSSIVEETQQVIADFMLNRANNILNTQPDITGFLTGSNNSGGGPLGNLALNAHQGSMNLAFSTSLSRIEQAADRRIATLLNGDKAKNGKDRNAETLAAHRRIMGAYSEQDARRIALAYGDDTGERSKAGMALAGLAPQDATGEVAKAMGASTHADDTMPANRFDVWTQLQGTASQAGDSSSSLWVGYAGAHYFVTKDMIVGALVQFDWSDETNRTAGSSADGTGWMAGPYIAGRVAGTTLMYEARAAWGQSSNHVSPIGTYSDGFDTTRWMTSGKVEGAFTFDSLTVKPSVSVSYYEETQQSYTDSLSNTIPEQTISLGEVRFGPEFSWTIAQGDGSLIQPKLGVSGVWNFDISDNPASQGYPLGDNALRARFDAGLDVTTPAGWTVALEGFYDGVGVSDYRAWGGKARLVIPVN